MRATAAGAEAVNRRRILVVDDEPRIRSFLAQSLSSDGYAVETVASGAVALHLAARGGYGLIVLDLLLPDVDGFAVLRAVSKAQPDQPVLVLSALADVNSKVRCLELGATDYLAKPFAVAELLARVRCRMRAAPARGADGDAVLQAGSVTLDVMRRTATGARGTVSLSSREFLLLQHLMSSVGRVCPRAQILGEVWGYSFDPGTNVVDVYVARLRAKLGDDVIETVRNVGYALSRA